MARGVSGVSVLLLAGLIALAQEGGASNYEALVKEMIGATDRITTVLTGIKDSTSAAGARPELKKAAERFLEIRKQADKLKQPEPAEKERIARAYQKPLSEAVNRLKQEIARVQTVPGGRDTLQELAILEPPRTDPDRKTP